MADAMLLGVAKSVLGQLSSPALNEFLLVWNFKNDLKRLSEVIETITCFIHDAEQRQSKELVVKLWLSRLKSVLYEADDLFDAIGARALCKKAMDGNKFKKEVTLFFSKSNQLSFVLKTAHNIKAIRECLGGIKDDMSSFQLQYQKIEENHTHRVLGRDETHSFVEFKNVIGRDQEKEDIINLLLSEEHRKKNFGVVSVIGFGGLGKTTLAQLVYNDERVQKGFDLCLWTCINYFFDLKVVLVKILTSALKSKPEDLDLDQLQSELRKSIEGKKYLLVVDDVWDEIPANWDRVGSLLNCGRKGSKVLITTRKTKVAQCLDAIEPYYRISVLSEETAWSLFVKMAFKDGEFDGDHELVLLGKQILRKCGYVPLAISSIGRMLRYRKKDKEEWFAFLEKELEGVLLDDGDDKLMKVLKVSYNDLPFALKRCFAYCSVFPKDHDFEKDELVRMWVAQGFVEPYAKRSLEEIGGDYFLHLVNRCFFQEVERDATEFGIVQYRCKMHDLLHDLAIQVAGLESSCFEEKDLRNVAEMSVLRDISVIHSPNCSPDYSNLSSHSKTLRTLRCGYARNLEKYSLSLVLERFRMLRTLNLSFLNFRELPDSFGGLIHLRYLDLSWNTKLTTLPKSICNLILLHTLMLSRCEELKELPSNLGKLVSLRHLLLTRCDNVNSMPLGFATLTTLVSLDRFIVDCDSGGLRYLGCLDELCGTVTLDLPSPGWTNCIEDAKKSNMASKCKLSGMVVKWTYTYSDGDMTGEERKAVLEELQPHANLLYFKIQRYKSDKLPSWVTTLSNLKELSLQNCSVEYLDLSVRSGYLLPCLESLELYYMRQLKGWWREAATSPKENAPLSTIQILPRVSKLVIKECLSLVENMPLFGAVEELELYEVDVKLVRMLLSTSDSPCFFELHGSSKLKVMKLSWIKGIDCLPEGWMKHLTALKTLEIENCGELRWVSSRGLACLTSLEELKINDRKSVRLEDKDDENQVETFDINNRLGMPWKALNRLRRLEVPWQHHLQEGLQYLTSLEELRLRYCEGHQVKTDNDQDLEDKAMIRWQGLQRLRKLELKFSEEKTCCFPKGIIYLPCLQELKIWAWREMNVDEWMAEQTQFNSLVSLSIRTYKQNWLYDIPWKLFPSLRTLEIGNELRSIPDGIQSLTSLRDLNIWGSMYLFEVPKWMINLTSLQHLTMNECCTLVDRCERETGVDWPLISHIPTTEILRKVYIDIRRC